MIGSVVPIPSVPDPKLDQNIMLFVRLLRQIGFRTGPASMIDAVEAVQQTGLASKAYLYHALASSLIKRHEDQPLFDQAFRLFWRNPQFHEKLRALLLPQIRLPGGDADQAEDMARRLSDALSGPPETKPDALEEVTIEFDATATATDTDRILHKDFDTMSADELRVAETAIARLAPKLPKRLTRRYRHGHQGKTIDLRAALRDASRRCGLVMPRFRSRIEMPCPLVILCDISGSMEQYSRVMLHFIHRLSAVQPRVHSFLFGTKLTNISRQMRQRDVDLAIGDVAARVDDWSGGTRISDSLAQFNREWGRRVLGEGAVVLLITDGLDRTRDDGLSAQMERLGKSTSSLIWLNPLLRFDGFVPKSHSIRAMMPHVDQFLPIHSLQSIIEIADSLGGVDNCLDPSIEGWRRAARLAALAPQSAAAYAQEKE